MDLSIERSVMKVTELPGEGHSIQLSDEFLRGLIRQNPTLSAVKIGLYLVAIAALAAAAAANFGTVSNILIVIGLGITFAHGLELQHEALHGNLFHSRKINAIAGTVLGAPMLVSFTHYRSCHFHHHRFVGTPRDAELFDYSIRSLRNPVALFVRAWNLQRIPRFVVTLLGLLQNDFPDPVPVAQRKRLLAEYAGLAALLLAGLYLVFAGGHSILLAIWFIPWLCIAEPIHFLFELPEHLGCDAKNSDILRNTRSYPSNRLWAYLTNHNNFHIEHHLYPKIPSHRLRLLHEAVGGAQGHCSRNYAEAVREIVAAIPRS